MKATLIAGLVTAGIAALMLSMSLVYFAAWQDQRLQLQELDRTMNRFNDSKTMNQPEIWVIGAQISGILLGFGGVFFGLISSGLMYSYSKIISAAILVALGLFLLYFVFSQLRFCAPAEERKFDYRVPCRFEYYIVPFTLVALGAILIVFSKNKKLQTKR